LIQLILRKEMDSRLELVKQRLLQLIVVIVENRNYTWYESSIIQIEKSR